MKKQDARKLSKEIQQHNRNQAIRLFTEGTKRADIAKGIGVHYLVVCDWIRAWRRGGTAAIQLKKRGRGSENQRLLTEKQEDVLRHLLTAKNPQQLKLPFALWNRKAIQSVIYQMWRVKIAIRRLNSESLKEL